MVAAATGAGKGKPDIIGATRVSMRQAVVEEFEERLDGVGDHLVPVAEGGAGNVHAVADLENARGAVMRPVVAVFGSHDLGHDARRGTKPPGRRRG
jgi:hypothetical protein